MFKVIDKKVTDGRLTIHVFGPYSIREECLSSLAQALNRGTGVEGELINPDTLQVGLLYIKVTGGEIEDRRQLLKGLAQSKNSPMIEEQKGREQNRSVLHTLTQYCYDSEGLPRSIMIENSQPTGEWLIHAQGERTIIGRSLDECVEIVERRKRDAGA